jgi:hypothetical protein
MLPIILGAVAVGTVGYGIKKFCEDNDDICPFSSKKQSYSKPLSLNTIKDLLDLEKQILDDDYKEFQTTISTFNNLKIDKIKTPQYHEQLLEYDYQDDDIDNFTHSLYYILQTFHKALKQNIVKIETIKTICQDFKTLNKNSKEIISDTIVIANTIHDIIDLNFINKNKKIRKKAYKLLAQWEEQSKVLSFEKFTNIYF